MDKSNAYVYVDENDGMIAIYREGVWMPMCFLSERMAKKLYPEVKNFMRAADRSFKLLKYENPVDITETI